MLFGLKMLIQPLLLPPMLLMARYDDAQSDYEGQKEQARQYVGDFRPQTADDTLQTLSDEAPESAR